MSFCGRVEIIEIKQTCCYRSVDIGKWTRRKTKERRRRRERKKGLNECSVGEANVPKYNAEVDALLYTFAASFTRFRSMASAFFFFFFFFLLFFFFIS